jgi:hypothetical protein
MLPNSSSPAWRRASQGEIRPATQRDCRYIRYGSGTGIRTPVPWLRTKTDSASIAADLGKSGSAISPRSRPLCNEAALPGIRCTKLHADSGWDRLEDAQKFTGGCQTLGKKHVDYCQRRIIRKTILSEVPCQERLKLSQPPGNPVPTGERQGHQIGPPKTNCSSSTGASSSACSFCVPRGVSLNVLSSPWGWSWSSTPMTAG